MTASSNITFHSGAISRSDRETILGMKGRTIWLTGLSASGKSTVASELENQLISTHKIPAYRLDGDNLRFGLNSNLGFSPADRTENIRRVGEVAKLFADSGMVVIACFISPYAVDRENVRRLHTEAGLEFVEVFVDCPLEVLETRDPKGLYKKARAGLIKQFTGIDAPYERPLAPQVYIDTNLTSVPDAVEQILSYMRLGKL
eukprot:Partr_v1_DN22785_c0_g1_i1_m37679 putative Catalyzes the synthesis of activated sulfate (By similarity)